jgi:hypothetical protein
MSTKFVSKNSNYMLVLKPGVEGNRALGTHAVPGLYIKFQSGMVDIKEESVIELLRAHPSCGVDYIEIKEDEVDPFLDNRDDSEPNHIIQEIKYGHAEKAIGSTPKVKLSPQMKKVIENEAMKMLPGLLKSNPKMLKDLILGMAAEMKEKEVAPEVKHPEEKEGAEGDKKPVAKTTK